MDSTAATTRAVVAPRTWRKVGFRIIPLVGLAYVASYIDRANVGYIAAPMSRDLHLTSGQIGLAAGLFFIGYILVEVPSNMMLRRFGARKWIARIMITWGLVTAATAAVNSAATLFLARLLLGLAEAGLAAGILLYLTLWFPRRQRSWALSAFFLMTPVSSVIGSPLAAALLEWGQNLFGIAGWRSLFLVEGVLTILVSILILAFLPDRPGNARWLDDREKAAIEATLAAETDEHRARGALTGLRQALTSGRVWLMAVTWFAIAFGLYPLQFFLPTMIRSITHSIGKSGDVSSVLLSAIPYAVAVLALLLWARFAARRTAVTATAVPMTVGVAGLLLATFTSSGTLFVVAVCVSVAGIMTAMPQFWRIPAIGLTGAAAASGIALINSVSNVSGFVGPYFTGAIASATGSFTWALLAIAIIMTAGLAVLLSVGRRMERLDGSLS
ncbi:MFS transporter [Amycolatopsis thermophila]|uniref:Sugar phosphate permease n=1 Tax=Amycolatopsis thermophila TaxID=206084 RepID=A0ABU0EM60_9PSEU|nr:MFS transporter [Amycolatopsis thermophila]MDQ0376369.1 sugar phosphate permease [Amycolatopsis thermophila]